MKTKKLCLEIILNEEVDLDENFIYALALSEEKNFVIPKEFYLDRVEKSNGKADLELDVIKVSVKAWSL